MYDLVRRVRRWWHVRRLTRVRNGLLKFGDTSNPTTKWQIDALTRAIEDAKQEAARTGRQP